MKRKLVVKTRQKGKKKPENKVEDNDGWKYDNTYVSKQKDETEMGSKDKTKTEIKVEDNGGQKDNNTKVSKQKTKRKLVEDNGGWKDNDNTYVSKQKN